MLHHIRKQEGLLPGYPVFPYLKKEPGSPLCPVYPDAILFLKAQGVAGDRLQMYPEMLRIPGVTVNPAGIGETPPPAQYRHPGVSGIVGPLQPQGLGDTCQHKVRGLNHIASRDRVHRVTDQGINFVDACIPDETFPKAELFPGQGTPQSLDTGIHQTSNQRLCRMAAKGTALDFQQFQNTVPDAGSFASL